MGIKEKKWEPLGKKHNWLDKSSSMSFELIVKDETNRKVDKFFWNSNGKYKKILELLRLKYNLEYRR